MEVNLSDSVTMRWRSASLALVFSLVAAMVLYWPTIRAMVAQWNSNTYSHGYLVLPASLYFIWKRRNQVSGVSPNTNIWAVAWLVPATIGWLMGNLTTTAVVEQCCVILILIGLVWGVLGTAVVRPLLFPLAFLLFAVPLGEGLIPWLQDFSAVFVVKLLALSRIPVLLEGRYITVPHGRWEVADICSGVRYLITSLAVGFLFAGVVYRSWARRIGFFAASAVIPIVANGVRIYGIIVLGELSGEREALRIDHKLAGLGFFSIIMLLLFLVGMRWREDQNRAAVAKEEPASLLADASESGKRNETSYFRPRTLVLSASFLVLIALAPLSTRVLGSSAPGGEEVTLGAPKVGAPWSITAKDDFFWSPQFVAPTNELRLTYERGGRTVKVALVYYRGGQAGGKLVSTANELYDRPHWMRTGETRESAKVNGETVQMHEVRVESADSALVIWHCYWVDGEFTSNDYRAKLLQAKGRLFGSRRSSVAIVLATENPPPESKGADVLRDFLSHASWQTDLRLLQEASR